MTVHESHKVRNPFNVMDVPDPAGPEVLEFATVANLDGSASDDNAETWASVGNFDRSDEIEGAWSSRWNGGADPTIPGDTEHLWKEGKADVKTEGERIYLLFDWNGGARRGMIDACREGSRLVGKYINLSDPAITRPWIGLVVDHCRIDGRWPAGRLDFRRLTPRPIAPN